MAELVLPEWSRSWKESIVPVRFRTSGSAGGLTGSRAMTSPLGISPVFQSQATSSYIISLHPSGGRQYARKPPSNVIIMSSPQLSPAQAHALFDILTHQETYSEIELFKDPQAIHKYGYPFPKEQGQPCVAPIMHTLFSKFMLSFPGLCDVPVEFWSDRILSIMEKLAAGDLSESYDKGAIGLRKTMSTASSAILEYPAKGILGGYPKKEVNTNRVYDMSQAADIMQGWEDFSQELIYGDMMDTLFDKVAETDDLTQHPVLIQVAHEYILVK